MFCRVYLLLLFLTLQNSLASGWHHASWRTAPPTPGQTEDLRNRTAEYLAKPLQSLVKEGRNAETDMSHARPEIEWTVWRLAHLYRLTGEPVAAEAAAALLEGLASAELPEAPRRKHIEGRWIPYPAVIAYGMLKDADIWPVLDKSESPIAQQETIRTWLLAYRDSFLAILDRPGQVTNYTPFGLRHAASLALVTEDAFLMERCLDVALHLAFSNEFWYSDLIWQEGTVSYARQVTGNIRGLLPMLEEGLGLGWLAERAEYLERLRDRLEAIDEAQSRFSMPGGRPIPVNDTHWHIPPDSLPRAPAAIAFPDFGHFSLPGGDMELHLSVPALTGGGRYGGGHLHDSRLSIQLWAHGQEVLPDAGYPFYPANHRYFHMSPYAHNTAVALDPDAAYASGPYGVWEGEWARSALMGYEDGSVSGGQVTYLAASSPGPESDRVHTKHRQLIQVRTSEWSGYVVDVFWLGGGTIHRWFLRQTECEEAVQALNVELIHTGESSMASLLQEPSEGDTAWTALLRNPKQIEDGGDAFNLSWTGLESRVALTAHLAPQKDSTSWISQMPRVRPTGQNPLKRDDFPGWHLLRQREVSPGDITLWAAVYEPVDPNAKAKIHAVRWSRENGDGSGIRVEVELEGRTDIWLLNLPDRADAVIDGLILEGAAAGFSRMGTEVAWEWNAAGSRLMDESTSRPPSEPQTVFPVHSLSQEEDQFILRVKGSPPARENDWALLRFDDGSGRAVRIGAVLAPSGTHTYYSLDSDPGLRVEKKGMRRLAFPPHNVPGPVTFRLLGGEFTLLKSY